MLFTIVGFVVMLGITFGPAAYILYLGHWQRQFGTPYPIGALVAAAAFAVMGFVVLYNSPFHLTMS